MAKKVLQISYYSNRVINEFKSLTEAAKEVGVEVSNISLVCRGKAISAGGYRWVYKRLI